MGGTHRVVMGDRGRLVIPHEVRSRHHLHPGDPLVLLEAPDGLLLLTREQVKSLVRRDLAGAPLVEFLIADRIREATEDAERPGETSSSGAA